MDEIAAEEAEVDIWRDTPVRYLGYANEVGEACRAFLPGWGVPASYALAISYVLADTADKAAKEWKISAKCETDPSTSVRVRPARARTAPTRGPAAPYEAALALLAGAPPALCVPVPPVARTPSQWD